MSSLFHFDLKKTAQAVACLIRLSGSDRHNYTRLLKLLYIADRRSIQQTGRPVTGDRVVAMRQGPVLSRVYDLMKGRSLSSLEWYTYFETRGFDLAVKEDPGNGCLSRYEVELLQQVWNEYISFDPFELCDYTHTFKEWQKNQPPKDSSQPIPFEDIAEALGLSDRIPEIEETAKDSAAFSRMFG